MIFGAGDEGERCGYCDAAGHRRDVRVGFVGEYVVLVVLHRVPGRNEAGREDRAGIVDLDRVLLDPSRLVNDRHIKDEPAVVTGITATLWSVAGSGHFHVPGGPVENLPVFVEIVGGVRKGDDCSDYMFLNTVFDGRSGPGLVPINPHVAVDVSEDLRGRGGRGFRTALRVVRSERRLTVLVLRVERFTTLAGLRKDRPSCVFGHRDVNDVELPSFDRVVELLVVSAIDGAGDNEVGVHG